MSFEDLIAGAPSPDDGTVAPIDPRTVVARLTRKGLQSLDQPSRPAAPAPSADFGADDEVVQPPKTAKPAKAKAPKADLSFGDDDDIVTPTTAEKPVEQVVAPPLPKPRPADAPQRAVSLLPTAPLPEVQPLEDAGRFRAPSNGSQANMLTGDEAFAERAGNIQTAEAGVAQARERLAVAEQRMAETTGAKTKRGTPADLQRLAIAAEVDTARENLRVAENDLSAATRANPPTQDKARDAALRFASAVGQMGPDIIGGIARPIDAGLDALGVKDGTGTAKTMRGFSERIGRTYLPDPTRDEELSAKLGQGVGSAIGFMLTGAVGRAAGASAKATSMVAGGAQNAEQYYREADALSAPAYKKAIAYMTGGAIGATEGLGLGRYADEMDKTTGGGVRRYFGLVLKQMGEEGLQEGVQQFLENIAKFGLFGKDPGDITANVATNALVGALLGMGMAGTMGAPALLGGRKVDANIPTPTPETVAPEEIQRQASEPPSATPEAAPASTAPASVAATPSAPEAQSTTPPETPQNPPAEAEKAPENGPSSGVDENALLRAYGYSDEQIADMSEAQRKAEVDEAVQSGLNPDDFGADDVAVGSRAAPVALETPDDLKAATQAASSDYTPAQGEANNRKLGHVKWNGLDISIETEAGGVRKGQNPETKEPWETRMGAAYGYIKGTTGADNMHVDVFMGDDPKSKQVYVINEVDGATGKFRQHKIMAGFASEEAARAAYLGTSTKSEKTLGSVVPMPVAEFKKWIKSGNTKAEVKAPAAKQKVSDDPVSLLQFIASKGGLKPDGDLRAMDAGKHRVQIPGRKGFFGLIKNDGMTLDYARSLAQQEGYFPPDPENAPPTGSVRDFLNAIEDELRGNRRQKIGEEGLKTRRELDRIEDENIQREAILDQNREIIEHLMSEYGFPPAMLNAEDVLTAAAIMEDEGLDPDDALERAAIRNLEKYPPPMATADEITDTFGWGAIDAVQPDPAQEDVETAARESGGGERSREESGYAEPRLDLSGVGDDRARSGESETDQEAIRAEQATDEGAAANSELEFGANDDEVAPQQQPKAKGKAKPETPKKLSKADAKYEAEQKARQAKLEAALAKLPDGLDEIIADTKATIDKFDAAMRAGDKALSRELSERLDNLEIKANGGTSFGVATEESDAEKVRNAASAPIGEIPKWGQRGVFMLNVDGMDFIVTHDAGSGAAIYAAHEDQPFPSDTGYRSMLSGGPSSLGKSVEQSWRDRIEAYIAEERGSGRNPKTFATPDAWYQLPDDYAEGGMPELVGNHWEQRDREQKERDKALAKKGRDKATVQASDADEVVEVSLTSKGPWDFNDTWPKPEKKTLKLLEREGRNPFESTDPDAEEVSSMLDEGMNAIMSDIAELRGIDERIDDLRTGKAKLKKKQTLEDALKPLQRDRATFATSLRDTRASHADLFGGEAANAMVKEARRRILQEEITSPETTVKPEPEAETGVTLKRQEDDESGNHVYEFKDRKGNDGELVIREGADKSVDILWVGPPRDSGADLESRSSITKLDLGTGTVKWLKSVIADLYPDAETITGFRISGAKSNIKSKHTDQDYEPIFGSRSLMPTRDYEDRWGNREQTVKINRSNKADEKDGPASNADEDDAPKSRANSASWVITEKKTGNVIMETFDRKKVEALNTAKYEAVPIAEHLAGLSEKPKATTEKTEAGQQTVLPGAEKIGDGELAQRKADERLKPKAAQKPADIGLFGDESQQTDLANKPAAKPAEKSFDDIFDDVMEEEFGAQPEPKPRAPKKPKTAPTQTKAAKPRTAGAAAKSAAKNAAMGLDDVVSGLTKLFGGDKLSSGLSFDEDTYRQALPYFKSGVAHFKEAAQDLTEVIRALIKHLRKAGMDADAIQKMRPYIQRFTDDVASGKESLDAPGSSDVLEPDSGDAAAGDRLGAADVPAAAGADGRGAGERGNQTDAGDERSGSGVGLSQDHAPVLGADGNLELPHREPVLGHRDAPAGERERGPADSEAGLPLERVTTDEAVRLAEKEANLAARREAQRRAESIAVKPADPANIAATLPMLFPEQQDDVLKTEQRFTKPNGHGMLLTNGTGTGKTYSGLGVVKRFAKQGKTGIIVVAPSQGILMDWVRSAKDLGIDMSILDSTQDAGRGIVATTYANFGQNRHLADREWDLVVTDEAHKLSSDQNGTPTAALGTLRALTLHPDGMQERARMVLRSEWDRIDALHESEKAVAYRQFQENAQPLIDEWKAKDRPKTLMMSATPFAYHFSLDYAEGYLFEFDREQKGEGYNSGDGRDRFYMENLGYRMRTNRLTKPDADVRGEVMERELHERLKREGALAGRALTVDKDYDRKFILVNDAIGNQIDRALSFLQEADNGKFRALGEIVGKRFDYLARMRLLEAIKAEASIPYIKKSLALGRKVVVFHDYNEGGGSSPFHMSFGPEETVSRYVDGKYETVKLADLYSEFRAQNPYVDGLDFSSYASPLRAIQKAFPDALIYNGTVPVKVRDQAKKLFNDDNSGRDIIVVQSAAGEAGISLHDTTGKKQRVLLNLGMPVRPTTSIQQEGRIYRVGQATDAIFRYMNTGTNWERWTFAGKIAERAGTAENLALGNLARTIRQSFIDSFNDADTFEPTTGEGTGGKEADKAMSHSLSEFDKAKTHYFAQSKKTGRRDQREGIDYFATPEPVGLKMVEFANIKPGEKVLEPSAGHGAIARYFPEDSARTMIEPSNDLASRAAMTSPGARVVVDRFENFNIVNKFDAIVMNPPFGSGGKTAIEHIEKAVAHLKNGGRIVALIPRGPSADKRFDKFMDSEAAQGVYIVGNILLPSVTFERAGTSVAARIVVLEKQTDEDTAKGLQQKDRDYTNAETINELFDRIEQADMGQRREPVTKEADTATEGNVTVDGIEFTLRTSDDGKAYFAALKSYIPSRFRTVAKAAEAFGGLWIQGSKLFTFGSQEARQQFLDRVANPPPEDAATAAQPGVSFNLAQTKHSKTGADLFVAALKDRVDRDQYTSLNSTAKANGGWYSAFRGAGAIPGFQFKSEADRAKFLAVVSGETKPDVQASLGRVTEPSTAPAPTLSPEKRANLEAALTAVVRRIVGPDVTIRFSDTIPLTKPPQGWGSYQPGVQRAAGSYTPAEHLLRVALADPAYPLEQVLDTTFHEAFHALENRLLTDDEMDVLKREDARLRDIVKRAYGFTDDQVRDFAGFEVRAIAFEHYASQRAQGISPQGFHVAIRRAFERLMDLFRQVANYVRGLGFQSAESIFAAAYEGQFANRQQKSAQGETQANIRQATPPRGNLNTHDSFEPLPERWQDWWKQPDLKWSDRVWGMIDAAFLGTNRAIGDKYVDMRRMQAAVEAAGRPVGENIDMALNASLFEGRTEKRLKDYWLRTWKPVLDRAAEAGISREDLHTYLYARHAPERNERIAEINEDMPDGGSGMTNDEAQEIMDGFTASGQREALERIAQDIDGIVRSIRDMMVADQLENERTTEAWSRSYQHYVPLKGFEAGDESIGVGADGRSGGFDVRGPETRRALGRSSKADDVLSNLFLMGERTIIRGEQNRVARSAMRFMQSNPQPSLFTIQRAERVLVDARPETMRQEDLDLLLGERPVTVEIRNPQTGLVTVVTKVASQFAKDTFAAKIGGHTYYITIKHPGLLAALKNVGVQRLPMLIRAHAWLTRQFAAFRTARNPDWFIANLSRDIQDAAYTVSAEQREALLKNFAANIATLRTYMAAFMGEAMEGNGLIGKWARSKFADKRGVAAYEAWKKAGGQIAFMGIHDLESAKDEIERAFRLTEGESWMKSIAMAGPHTARGLLKAIEYFNGAIEAGTRLAVFDAAIKAGLTPAKAAMLSKESTTNFNRKGIYSPFINSFYAFFNARVQGAIKHVRLLRNSKMARKAALGLVVGGFATTMWNLAAAPDDEEDKKNKYAKRKYWERERYFIIYMPGSSEPFRMPMGFGLQLFWMLGENLAMLSQGKITPAEAAVNYLSTIVGAFSPFSAEGSPVDPGTWLRLMMPSIETPLVDLYTNENWRRKPIHPKFGGKGQPHSEQYFTTTSPVAIDMAQFLNRATGGNAFKPGKIDLYPGDLQYVWEFAAGGLGQTVNRTDAMVRNWVNGVPTPINQIPVLRHFVGQDTKQTATEGYYEDRDAVQKGMSQVRKALKTDASGAKADDAAATIEDGKAQFGVKDGKRKGTVTSDAEALFRAADKEIKELRGQESTVRADPTMSRADKAKLIDTIRTNIRQVQEETRGKYRKLKESTAR